MDEVCAVSSARAVEALISEASPLPGSVRPWVMTESLTPPRATASLEEMYRHATLMSVRLGSRVSELRLIAAERERQPVRR